jgi:DNA-binding NarL/FixJ family response regulator
LSTKSARTNEAKTGRERIRVVVAEGNPLVISALREMLECDGRFELLDAVQSGRQFLELAAAAKFDVAVVGWKLADMDSADVLAEVQNRKLDIRVTVFSNDHDIGILKQCVRLGVQGYCFQFDEPPIIFETILAVAHGRICIPYIDINKVNDTPLSQLTVRERELLAVLSDGWTNLQIATRTGISENTVKYHLKNLYDKLDVRNRAMAVALYSSEKRRPPR